MLDTFVCARALDSYGCQGMCLYMCMVTVSRRPDRQCGPTGFATLRCEGTRRRVVVEQLEA